MWQDRRLWAALIVLAFLAVVLSTRYFPRAFPLVSVELELDRRGALAAARELAERHSWVTVRYEQAASFGQRDDELKRYIELEAGGPEAWSGLVESGEHQPYQWRVRQFREGEATEAELRFAPDGRPLGFALKLPEDEPGASMDAATARQLAEQAAVHDWGVDLGAYAHVESRQEVRPGGRMDHSFVYERSDLEYGEARFRLRLGVAGDIPGEVTRFVEVPEAFKRRHAEMRSANNLIALMASLGSGVLYLVLGAGVGLVMLLRRRWVLWKRPLLWGGIVGGLMMAASLNALPLAWMTYDTAVPRGGFLTTQLMSALFTGIGIALFVTLVIMAGESLSRRAFPHHVQLWRTWSPGVANSRPLLGLTVGGYLFAAFFVAYAVFFYLFANRVLGWPMSGESLLHPDILAMPFPWLSAVAISLMAGFSEEAMFRAIPLAGAALIAARYGRRGLWLSAALLVQALIFAAAHASYAQQPSYARVVELFIPSILLGLVFLRYGFLPAVVAHFAYDMVWFSLPVFASSAPGTWLNQTLLVVLGLAPLGIVLSARARHGAMDAPPASAYNGAWRPEGAAEAGVDRRVVAAPAVPGAPGAAAASADAMGYAGDGGPRHAAAGAGSEGPGVPGGMGSDSGRRLPAGLVRWAPALGAAGVVLWLLTASFRPVSPPLEVGAGAATEVAREALDARALLEADADAPWRLVPSTHTALGRSNPHRFVWETAGEDVYGVLLGSYLAEPHWHVRALRFEGELAARAEELLVEVDPRGGVYRIRHTLPEERPGAELEEAAARALALAAARETWGLEADALRQVSAAANRRPARVDWTFTFGTPASAELAEGETRVRVVVSGDRVTDATRFIHVPEQWERDRRARATQGRIISGVSGVLLLGLIIGALVVGVARLARRRIPGRLTALAGAGGLVVIAVNMANGWPSTLAQFSTSEPYGHQVMAAMAGLGFVALLGGALVGLLAGLAHAWADEMAGDPAGGAERSRPADWRAAFRLGLPAGALLAGVLATAALLGSGGPPWASYDGADAVLPALAALLGPLQNLFTRTIFLLLALGVLVRLPARGRGGLPTAALMAVGLGLIIGNGLAGETVLPWLLASALATALLFAGLELVRHAGPAVLPAIAAATVLLDQVPAIVHGPYPGASVWLVAGCVLVVPAAAAWAGMLPAGGGRKGGVSERVREAVAAGGVGLE